jgi:hypothetical protein
MSRWTEAEISALLRAQRLVPVPLSAGVRPSERWPDLAHFFGGYLHQDFELDGTPEQCVARAVEDHSQDERKHLVESLAEIRAEGWSEDQLARVLDDFGMYYLPYADDRTHEEWVDYVARMVARSLGT